jgi:hypothetical protein
MFESISEAAEEAAEGLRWKNIKREHLMYLRVYGWFFAMALIVALLVPDNILTSYPFLEDYFVTPIASLTAPFLAIQEWAKISKFPEVTRFTFAILWITLPITLIHQYRVWPSLKPISRGQLWFALLIGYLLVPFLLFLPKVFIVMYTTIPVPKSYLGLFARKAIAFAATSRFGLGLFAPFILFMVPACLPGFIIRHKDIFSKNIQENSINT